MAVHDAVNWSAVATLPPFQDANPGALPLPRHSLRIRRATSVEDGYQGWAFTESVPDLGISVVLPDPLQVVYSWFGNQSPMGPGRRHRDWDSTGGGRETSRRRGEYHRLPGWRSSQGSGPPH